MTVRYISKKVTVGHSSHGAHHSVLGYYRSEVDSKEVALPGLQRAVLRGGCRACVYVFV